MSIKLSNYDYHLPDSHIANAPVDPRDHSKLMVLNRQSQTITHRHFFDLPQLLTSNDVLVLNQTKVIPARLYGHKQSGGKVEILLLRQKGNDAWEAISKPGLKLGQEIVFSNQRLATSDTDDKSFKTTVISLNQLTGEVTLQFNLTGPDLTLAINEHGQTPIPPYIHSQMSEAKLRKSYQTVYAKQPGSAAAPTAGLHFTPELLDQLQQQGIQIESITLHVGPGTFQRLRSENLEEDKLHLEHYYIDPATAQRLNQAKQAGKRIIAVGTTTTRTLESSCRDTPRQLGGQARRVSTAKSRIKPGSATTQLFIHPPYQFHFVDALITNFHLPESSLLMLVAAFTTTPQSPETFNNFQDSFIGQAYQTAIANDYRFFSFGDAMLIQ